MISDVMHREKQKDYGVWRLRVDFKARQISLDAGSCYPWCHFPSRSVSHELVEMRTLI